MSHAKHKSQISYRSLTAAKLLCPIHFRRQMLIISLLNATSITEAARLIRTLENTEEAKRWCFQGFIKVLFPMTLWAGCAHWCSPLEKQALLYMAQWRSRERGQGGDSCLLWRKVAEPRLRRIWEKTPNVTNPKMVVTVGGRSTRR